MPPKPQKPKAPVGYKAGALVKDILPASVKNPAREGRSIRVPEASAITANAGAVAQLYAPVFEEFAKIDEWPGDEAARTFDFQLESTNAFTDSTCTPFKLTPSMSSDSSNLIFWRRPQEFIQAEQEEISTFVNKYHLKRRTSQLLSQSDNPISAAIRKEELANSPQRNRIGESEEPKVAIKVFLHYEREETQQEADLRKKELAEKEKADKDKKAAKKPGKKDEPIADEKPGIVKDIRLNNIDMSYNYPADSKWIASQLQIIKDRSIRDCYSNKPIWTKIYPQQDGIPVMNRSGRYWVKLYYLGKERKIEIDDRMPVNFKGQCKFPRSTKNEEIWSCLFAKAIFKLIQISSDISQLKTLTGSGFVMYTLTGMLSQTIPMQIPQEGSPPTSDWLEKLSFLKDTLSDQHYTDQDIILTCYRDVAPQGSAAGHGNKSSGFGGQSGQLTTGKKNSLRQLQEDPFQEDQLSLQKDASNQSQEDALPSAFSAQSSQKKNDDEARDVASQEQAAAANDQPRSPFRRKTQRNLTTGGLAHSSTKIFETLSSRVKPELTANPDEETLENGKSTTAAGTKSARGSFSNQEQIQLQHQESSQENGSGSMSPSRAGAMSNKNRLITQMQKAVNLIQSAAKNSSPNYVISGYSYPVMECFYNDAFNMVFVQKRTDKEIKLRQDYIEHSNQSINKMSKEDKIEHRRKKKELRDRIGDEEKKRIELITRPPIQYKFFRLKSGGGRVPAINIFSPFSSEEIQIAKTCIANKLNKPPNYSEGAEIRDDGKSMISSVIKQGDDSLQMKPLDDFSQIQSFIAPMERDQGGVWVQEQDIYNNFQNFQVFYNPSKYPNHSVINVSQAVDSEVTIGDEHEVLLIERNSERENQNEKVMLLFGFSSKEAKNAKIVPEPYCILQKFDFGQFHSIHEYAPLRGNQSSQFTELDNSNQVFKLLVYTPVSFSVNISCNNTFRTMSVLSYLTEYEGYTVKNFNIEYQPMEEKKHHVMFRMRIAPQDFESSFLLKIRSSTDNQMLRYMRLKLVENDSDGHGIMLRTIEGVHKNLYESTFSISSYMRLTLRERTSYYLILEGEPPYSIAEGALSVDFFSKTSDLSIENLEHVEPLQYIEKYIPTKYGIIFREKMYVSESTVASFHLKIMEIIGGAAPAAAAAAAAVASDPKKKPAPGGAAKAGGAAGGSGDSEGQEKDLEAKRLIRLELFENGKSVQYAMGYNTSLLSNVVLKSTKSEETNYLLEATFDLRDWPDAKTLSAVTENLHWFLRVISTETVAIVRDTDKEDREKAIKKSWEDSEPGRAEKSKKARRKFEILQKQEKGEKLTEEELAIVSEPRLSKKQREEAASSNQAGGANKKAAKKDDKKPPPKPANAKGAKEEVVEEKKESRPVPLSINHQTNELRSFLEHMEQERVREELADHPGLIAIRSEEEKTELKQQADRAREEVVSMLKVNSRLRDDHKSYQVELAKEMQELLAQDRVGFKEPWAKFQESREEVKAKLGQKLSKEKELQDILRQEKPTISIADLEKLITECSSVPSFTQQLLGTAKKLVKNMRISQLSDKFTEAIGAFNIDALNAGMEEFTKYSVTGIEEELLQKVQDMLNEAKENPNFVADKLAEAKKAGKKGKK